jgi:hypothetical protein
VSLMGGGRGGVAEGRQRGGAGERGGEGEREGGGRAAPVAGDAAIVEGKAVVGLCSRWVPALLPVAAALLAGGGGHGRAGGAR